MSKRLTVIEGISTSPYENLALEEWLLNHVAADEVILYLWQNQHTVVIGKNQNAWKECNITTLEADGGHLARRLSGGGAVYHDLGNLNFTFLAQSENYDVSKHTDVILNALAALGIVAEKSGRNDILVDGRKISGNAFYDHKGRCYQHGTLLLNVDMNQMPRFLNVSKDKLQSKGVASVKSRVTNLVDVMPELDVVTLKKALCDAFARVYEGEPGRMSVDDVPSVEWNALVSQYEEWAWNYGRKFRFDRSLGNRFAWGRMDLEVQVEDGMISDAQVYSDALIPDFVDQLAPALLGKRYNNEALASAVKALVVHGEKEEAARNDLSEWLLTVEC